MTLLDYYKKKTLKKKETEANAYISKLYEHMKICNSTYLPEEYFNSFDIMLSSVNKLIELQKDVQFDGESPKQLKINIINTKSSSIRDLIDRYYRYIHQNYKPDFGNEVFKQKMLSFSKYLDIDNRNYIIQLSQSLPEYIGNDNAYNIFSNIDNMDGHDFEYYCANVLKKNGFSNVDVTQESGDHGIDILANKDDISYAIQCKCYSSNIGNAAVQQAHTGKSIYHKDIAVVLTNQYFTAQAKEEANVLGVKLWDRDKLEEMIRNMN